MCIVSSMGMGIDHFTVACLVACPLNESEAGGDLVLIETSLQRCIQSVSLHPGMHSFFFWTHRI